MSRARMGLTLEEHSEVGSLLRRVHRDLLQAAAITRCYERQSQQLLDIARSLMAQRGWLEQRLTEAVGADAAKEIYFGREEADA